MKKLFTCARVYNILRHMFGSKQEIRIIIFSNRNLITNCCFTCCCDLYFARGVGNACQVAPTGHDLPTYVTRRWSLLFVVLIRNIIAFCWLTFANIHFHISHWMLLLNGIICMCFDHVSFTIFAIILCMRAKECVSNWLELQQICFLSTVFRDPSRNLCARVISSAYPIERATSIDVFHWNYRLYTYWNTKTNTNEFCM